jgi:hypothetical protein
MNGFFTILLNHFDFFDFFFRADGFYIRWVSRNKDIPQRLVD